MTLVVVRENAVRCDFVLHLLSILFFIFHHHYYFFYLLFFGGGCYIYRKPDKVFGIDDCNLQMKINISIIIVIVIFVI